MKTIAYYISDYGFGHASRSIAVIRKLLNHPEVEIMICHSFALSFIKESLTGLVTERLKQILGTSWRGILFFLIKKSC